MPEAATLPRDRDRDRDGEIIIIVTTAKSVYAFFFLTPLY